jgi:hypothetical protein
LVFPSKLLSESLEALFSSWTFRMAV